ncbi:tiggy-winkle hedgehog protein-like [Clytia hemisphaerica]|uniref:Hint domain-containing protein n=1 Tax=Clytia hemisphaerica TaxID=252671 RepID=A0A7M5WZL9_9CNID
MDKYWKTCLLLCLLSPVNLCGPGRSPSHSRFKRLRKGDHFPEYLHSEVDVYDKNIPPKHCSELVQIITTDIIFKDYRFESDARKTTKICRKALLKLSNIVKSYWKGTLKLLVIQGYMSSPEKEVENDKLHMLGRAFNLELKLSKNPSKNHKVADHVISRLGELAYRNTQFQYVRFDEGGYLHVSCPCEVDKVESRCFPSNSEVNLQNGSRALIKDIRPGDSVLTMNQNGELKFDEVVMLMHQNKGTLIQNYVQITTDNDKSITISRHHLIFVSKTQTKYAKDVLTGDLLFTYDSLTKKAAKSIVTHIEHDVTQKGMHAPLTKSGTLIVNDVYASCYAMFPSHRVSHAVFWLWRQVYDFLKYFDFSIGIPSDEIHWYPDVFRKTLVYFNVL